VPTLALAIVSALAAALAAPALADDPDTYTPPSKQPAPKPKPGKPADARPAGKPIKPAPNADRLRDEGRELFGPGAGKPAPDDRSGAGADADGPAGWAIVLGVFRGEGAKEEAAAQLARVRAEAGLPEAYSVKRGDAYVIALGDFPGPQDARAQAELKRIQELEFQGGRAFPQAFLSPPADRAVAGERPEYNLARAKGMYGSKALYTLQVAVYTELNAVPTAEQLKEFRAKAEEAAYRLRQEGELAFYYHARDSSMVTVGIYDLSDFDPQVPTYKSARLREAQKRHPLNLVNGHELIVRPKAGPPTKQPSNLVALPER
jgi:hypothetical protein